MLPIKHIFKLTVSMLPLWIIVYFLNNCFLSVVSGEHPIEDITVILKRKPEYNRNAYPTEGTDTPTLVSIQMYIEGMSSFRAQTMQYNFESCETMMRSCGGVEMPSSKTEDFHVDIYFQQKWVDHRLAHNNSKRVLIKQPKHFDLIWHPDLYFANARTAEFHDITAPNFLLWIYPNGTIWYDYAYDIEQLIIDWNTANPIETNEEIRMPDMRLKEILPGLQNSTYATGVWSCATAEFSVNREIMHHIIQSYMPTALIVVISWFNFWLDVEAVPGRVSLSITTLLTLATQSSAARIALPQASYVKAIDVWMGACMTFVFSAMIEFTVVNFCVRHKPKKPKSSRTRPTSVSNHAQQLKCRYGQDADALIYEKTIPHCFCSATANDESCKHKLEIRSVGQLNHHSLNKYIDIFPTKATFPTRKRKAMRQRASMVEGNRKYAQMIDRRSRIYFPLSFIVFNAIYWIYYLHFAEDD